MQEVSGADTSPFLDTDELKMALRAWKVFGAFEKRVKESKIVKQSHFDTYKLIGLKFGQTEVREYSIGLFEDREHRRKGIMIIGL